MREGGKQSKADTPPLRDSKSPCWYLLHVVQNKSGDNRNQLRRGEHETSWKCFAISLPRIRNSISSDSYSQKCCFQNEKCFWANKAEDTLCWQFTGKHPSAGRAWFIGDNLWDLSPCYMSLSWGQIISAEREKYQERQRWETKRGGGKEKWLWGGGGITAQILFITIIHISNCDV